MEKVLDFNGVPSKIVVRLNATDKVKTVQNRFWHDDQQIRVHLHDVQLWINGAIFSNKAVEEHELEKAISELESIAKTQTSPPVDISKPTKEKLKKLGFS
jgi:hypothetical protein